MTKSIPELLSNDITNALKSKNSKKVQMLRYLKNAIDVEQKKTASIPLTADEIYSVIGKEIKKRLDIIDIVEQYSRDDKDRVTAYEQEAISLFESYLPPQIPEQEIDLILETLIAQIGKNDPKIMAKTMKILKDDFNGVIDRKMAAKKIQSMLA